VPNRVLTTRQLITCSVLHQLLVAAALGGVAIAEDVRPLRPSLASQQETRASSSSNATDKSDARNMSAIQGIGQQVSSDTRNAPLAARSLAAAQTPGTAADQADLMNVQVSYVVLDQPLDVVVQEVGRLAGYAVSTTREVRGKVASGRLKGVLGDVMQKLKSAHGLVTMRDGTRLFVASDTESQVRYIKVGTEAPARVREVLQNLKVDDLDSRVRVDEAAGLVQINAPPSISERIETILINSAKGSASSSSGVSVIRFGKRSRED
jgi:hypothetical protein